MRRDLLANLCAMPPIELVVGKLTDLLICDDEIPEQLAMELTDCGAWLRFEGLVPEGEGRQP